VSPDRSPADPAGNLFSPYGAPAPLGVAAALVFVQGLLTAIYGIGELFSLSSSRVAMGLTTAVFFVAYGLGQIVCAWGMTRLKPWSRGPVLLVELIWLGLAWNFRHGSTLPLAIGLGVVSAIVLAGVLHPRSVDVLNRDEHRHPEA
jgi:hypothetical protein